MQFQDQLAFERFRYWRGQMLRSQDFRDQAATDAGLRAWHNRAVHEGYGVSIGLTVTLVPNEKNELAAVEVEPGVAHDCFGHLLLLQRPQKFVLPALPGKAVTLVLVMRYRETACFPKAETMPARSCGGDSALLESPEFFWEPADAFQVEDGVPLFQASYKAGVPRRDGRFLAPSARPSARPHIATGCTLPGNTPWKPWNVSAPSFEGPTTVGAQTVIDTSPAGFTETPHYIAWLQGWESQVVPGPEFSWVLTHVQDALSTGFLFRVLWISVDSGSMTPVAPVMGKSYVCWVGCQEVSGSAGGLCTGPAPSCGCGSGTELFGKQE